MIDKFLELRNKIHANQFRFDVTPQLWKTHYLFGKEAKDADNLLLAMDNDALIGYAVFSIDEVKGTKACRILDICTDSKEVFNHLVDRLVEHCVRQSTSFIYFKQGDGRFQDVLRKKGFFNSWESTIMAVLLNPHELFSAISEETRQGKIMKLNLNGFDPIKLRIGQAGVQLVRNERPDFVMSTDPGTFMKLLFGRTSLLKEVVMRRISVGDPLNLPTARHFVELVKQKGWFIPSGDWL